MKTTINIRLTKNKSIPALSQNPVLRYFNFIALYFAQGIPEGMVGLGIPAWMAMNGKSAGEIAGFAIITVLPWSFKFVVAPLMDRYTFLSMGRKRPWILIGQLGLVLSCIYMAFIPDPLNNMNQLMIGAFMVSFFGAFQDVATDGMAVDVIPAEQQAKANGFMWGSKICGMSIALAIGSLLLNKYDLTTAMLTMAAAIAVIMLVPVFLRERAGEKIAPWTKGKASHESQTLQLTNWKEIFSSLFKVVRLRNSLLIAIILFICQGAFKYIGTIMPIFTVKELGWSDIDYSQNYASAKLIGGIAGMLIGGFLIDKFGKKRMLNIYFFGAIFLISILAFSKAFWADRSFIYTYMLVHNAIYTFSSIAIFAAAMQCCWKKVSASQFTLYMTIANLGQMTFVSFIGPITSNFSWQISLFAFAIFIAMAWFLLLFLNIEKQMQHVVDLEKKDLAIQKAALYKKRKIDALAVN